MSERLTPLRIVTCGDFINAFETPDPMDFLDPDDFLDIDQDARCEFCGCTYYDPCEGGCGWSEYYLDRGRLICTSCDQAMLTLEINLAVFNIWKKGSYESPHREHRSIVDGNSTWAEYVEPKKHESERDKKWIKKNTRHSWTC